MSSQQSIINASFDSIEENLDRNIKELSVAANSLKLNKEIQTNQIEESLLSKINSLAKKYRFLIGDKYLYLK